MNSIYDAARDLHVSFMQRLQTDASSPLSTCSSEA